MVFSYFPVQNNSQRFWQTSKNHAEYERIQVALLHYQPLLKMFAFLAKVTMIISGK